MGEGLSSIEVGPVLRKPRKKDLLTIGIAWLLAGMPASADAQDFNWGQFGRDLVGGIAQGQRDREGQERCLQTQIPSARQRLVSAGNELRTANARATLEADRSLLALRNRTDLTSEEKDIERRSIVINRDEALLDAQSRFDMDVQIANERVESCTPRRW